jgi:hypothetical protein
MRFQKTQSYMLFEKVNFLRFQIAIFKKCSSQTICVLRFGLKSHLLSTKSQF